MTCNTENSPAVEFIWLLFTRHMEIQAQFCIDANAKIVVHNKYLGGILVGIRGVCVIGNSYLGLILLFFIGMKNDSPPRNSKG